MTDNPWSPEAALARQNVDSGAIYFDTVEEMREYMAEFQLIHEAVLRAVGQTPFAWPAGVSS